MKYKIWNRVDSLITPTGKVFTANDVFAQYPASAMAEIKFIVCDAPISMGVFMEFEQTKQQYAQMGAEITEDMTDQEVLDAISYFEENPPEAEPSAEERIAAALEFQNLMTM